MVCSDSSFPEARTETSASASMDSCGTHADILAALSGLPQEAALRKYIDGLLNDRAIIAISRIGIRFSRLGSRTTRSQMNLSRRMRPSNFAIGVARPPPNQSLEPTTARREVHV